VRARDRSDATNEVQARIELTVIGTDESALRGIFDGLGIGGIVKAPMEKMFWGDTFGALIDKFGIGWQVNVTSH
jgi:PhnB protein